MNRRERLAAGLAVAGVAAVVVGVSQHGLAVAPGYEGQVQTGWGGDPNHEERLLVGAAALGAGSALASVRWRRLAGATVATGAVVVFYPVRAVATWARDPGLYTEVPLYSGETTRFVLGPEPFLLAAGGCLLALAGVLGWRARSAPSHRDRRGDHRSETPDSG